MKSKLSISVSDHAILHVASLIRIRPNAYHNYCILQPVYGIPQNIIHPRTFGCGICACSTPIKDQNGSTTNNRNVC